MPKPLYDLIDRLILDHLQEHGRTSNVELADAVRLSPTSCLRRTKALERDGVIAGYRADLDRERLGLGLTVLLMLKTEHSRTTSEVVENALKAIPHVVACHVTSGNADFFVELAVPDLHTFERVLKDRILAIGPVREARSTISIRTVVDRGPLPLDAWTAPRADTRNGARPGAR
ncbi:Lrp/AsnC family transcriptional regulator [Streptomyces sp. NPDC004111]|uniref:Lrp/AsnC family transcriptional regulator n=1 Tax=Streptomyces sp. NPDC004111 TaxID=3364690 RepID=UPI0036BF24E8